jgi:hypothetical protein
MIVHLVFDVLFILFNVVSATDSDSIWPSSQESRFPDMELTSNEAALTLTEPALSLNLMSLPSDESKSLFDNPESTNLFLSDNLDLVGDEPVELADCSSSEFSPAIGKSRVRRLDGGPAGCQNPDSTPSGSGSSFNDLSAYETLLSNLERLYGANGAQEELKQNSICSLVTANLLPWGVCSSGDSSQIEVAIRNTPDPSLGGVGQLFHLYSCTLGTFSPENHARANWLLTSLGVLLAPGGMAICPGARQDFYCCEYFDAGLDPPYGEYCALLSVLQKGRPPT